MNNNNPRLPQMLTTIDFSVPFMNNVKKHSFYETEKLILTS